MLGVPLLALLICFAATRTGVLVPQSDRPLPSWLAGPMQQLGFYVSAGVAIAMLTAIFVLYLIAATLAERVPERMVLGAVIAFNLIVLVGPPLFSTDVFSYQAYGRLLTIYHTNPYTHGPWAMQLDPIYPYIGAKWITTPSVYGPLFTLLSGAFAGGSIPFSEISFKVIAAVSSLAVVWMLWRAADMRRVSRGRAVALFGLNPMITLFGVGGAHNDLLMLLFTTAGLYAWLAGRDLSSSTAIVVGTAVKLTGALVFPFVAVDALRHHGFGERTRRFVLGAVLSSVLIAVPSFLVFGHGLLQMLTTLRDVQRDGQWQSIPGFFLNFFGTPNTVAITSGLGAIFALTAAILLLQVWRGKLDWIDGAGWATLAILLSAGSLLPWYVSWLMPLVGLSTSRRLFKASMWMCGIAAFMTVITYVPGAVQFLQIL